MEKKDYKKDDLTIHWNPKKCIHSAVCVKSLSSVFKPKERPWVQVEHAEKKDIMSAIDQCPSGALSYTLPKSENSETASTTVTIVNNGPARVKGTVNFIDQDGNEMVKSGIFAICRCGASEKKPFCDGAHKNLSPLLDE